MSHIPGPRRFKNKPRLARCGVERLDRRLLMAAWYVDVNSPGTFNGNSWNTAFTDLQVALAAAQVDDEIRVADGTYKSTATTTRTFSFQLKSGVAIKGGYAGFGASDPDFRSVVTQQAVLSGDIGVVGTQTDNSYHVVVADAVNSTAVLDGFVITAGSATAASGQNIFGGGIYIRNANPTISNCVITENQARTAGGIYVTSALSPSIINTRFLRNHGSTSAGGLRVAGAATLTGCTFEGNTAGTLGGGGILTTGSTTLVNCTLSGNSSDSSGGALYVGGSSTTTLVNCTASGNAAKDSGPLIYAAGGTTSFQNCVLWENSGTGLFPVMTQFGTVSATYSDFQGGWAGTGNLNVNPHFVRNPDPGGDLVWGTTDDDYGDLNLQSGSACLDAGSNSALPANSWLDFAGNERFSDIPGVRDPGAVVDMGAYERVGQFGVVSAGYQVNTHSSDLTFSRAMTSGSFGASDIVVNVVLPDGSLGGAVAVIGNGYDAVTRTASFTFPVTIADGNYRATILVGSVSDSGGNPLAASHTFDFFVLAGDANRDRTINVLDSYILATNWFGAGKTFSQGDFNYDGIVNAVDLGILGMKWLYQLEPPPPPPPAPVSLVAGGTKTIVLSRQPVRSSVTPTAQAQSTVATFSTQPIESAPVTTTKVLTRTAVQPLTRVVGLV